MTRHPSQTLPLVATLSFEKDACPVISILECYVIPLVLYVARALKGDVYCSSFFGSQP